jgi:restriction system protein
LINPLLRALHLLGGSGSVEEIYNKVVEVERLPDKVLAQQHDPPRKFQQGSLSVDGEG